jgi:hypothetical protein
MRYLHTFTCTLLLLITLPLSAQQALVPAPRQPTLADIEQRLIELTSTLAQTQQALQASQLEIQRLRAELDALKAASSSLPIPEPSAVTSATPAQAATQASLDAMQEQGDVLAAEIKQHDQTKVETASKYPLRVTGIALFNVYSNAGVVDDTDLPMYALARFPGGSHGSLGATLRQTVLGIEANGPNLGGATTSASVNIDFFGGSSTNASGYSSQAGYVRMRTASLSMDWDRTTLQAGYVVPLITPRSPTSYATLASPSLAGSGNLWTWAPELRVEQRFALGDHHAIGIEGGLILPYSPNYSNQQLDSPVSANRRPGYEGRVSLRAARIATASPHALMAGISGYFANQFYPGPTHIQSWAFAGDWQIPITRWIDISGEFYRGAALGGFGGGASKDVLTGKNTITGASITRAVDVIGGWSQIKLYSASRFEANMAYGIDNTFSASFDNILLPASTNALSTTARNQTFVGNLIFRPRAALIFSPEYRHIETWNYTGTRNVANVFTLSAGYQF